MGKHRIKPNYRRRVLRLPDLDHCKLAVLNSLGSPASRRVYEYAIDQFVAWYCSEPRLAFNRIVVVRYRMYLELFAFFEVNERNGDVSTATENKAAGAFARDTSSNSSRLSAANQMLRDLL